MTEILFNEESFKIIGACFEVHNEKVAVSWSRCIKNVLNSSSLSNPSRSLRSRSWNCATRGTS